MFGSYVSDGPNCASSPPHALPWHWKCKQQQNVLPKLSSSEWAFQRQIKNFSVSFSTYYLFCCWFNSFTQSHTHTHTSPVISLYLFSLSKVDKFMKPLWLLLNSFCCFLLKKYLSATNSLVSLDKVNRCHCSSNDFYQI